MSADAEQSLVVSEVISLFCLSIYKLCDLTKFEEEGYGTRFVVREEELELGATPSSLEELAQKGGRPKVRIDKLLRDAAAKTSNRT